MPQTTNVIDSVHTLERTDMSRQQAEALIQLLRDSIAEAVQHLATKAELAELRQNMATKAELAELRQNMATKAELAAFEARVMAHTDAQIALLRGELTEKMAANLKYTMLTIGFSTVAIIAALFTALFAMPTGA